MNRYSKFIAAAALMGCGVVQAAQPWSLDSCINYAIEHNINVKTRALEVTSGELSVTEAKDGFCQLCRPERTNRLISDED